MTNQEKSDLQWRVRFYLGQGKADAEILKLLVKEGFRGGTVKKYVKAFR